jgi:adenylate kinase
MMGKIIILMGVPGSGKGTQGDILSKQLMIPHISTGDIFRQMAKKDFQESSLLADCMKSGKLIPTDLVNKVVKEYILSNVCNKGCILDGYPRTVQQAEYFTDNLDAEVVVLFLDLAEEIALKRILGRISCASCGSIYNKYFAKPSKDGQCDNCLNYEFITRTDDSEETILTRLEEYRKETLPMIEYYKKKGSFFSVDAGQIKQKVADDLLAIVKRV